MLFSKVSRLLILTGLVLGGFSACGTTTSDDSSLKIDSGTYITSQSKNRVPAVFWLGNCTGTAISHNTLIYAAHCAGGSSQGGSQYGQRSGRVCIKKTSDNPENPSAGACSAKLFVHPEYRGRNYRYDVAVGIFPPNTFKNYFPVQLIQPSVGDKVLMVGYSSRNNTSQGLGSKRWGYNKVSGFGRDNSITSSYGRSANNVAVSPGDSGGPLFSDCKVVGVASRMSTGGTKRSMHTNLTIDGTTQWLRNLIDNEGATMCGVQGTDQSHCQQSQMGSWNQALRQSDQTQEFPCSPTTEGTQPPMQPNISLLIKSSNNSVLELYVGTKLQTAAQASVCAGRNICSGPEMFMPLLSSNSNVTMFGPVSWPAENGQDMTMMIKNNQGDVIGSRSIRLRKK